MGTVFSFDIRTDSGAAALPDVVRWLHRVDAVFSTYQSDSDINQLADGRKSLADCPAEVAQVLELCDRLAADTNGYFSAQASGRLDPSGAVKGWAVDQADAQLRAGGSMRHCINAGGDIRCAGGDIRNAGLGDNTHAGSDSDARQPWRLGIADPINAGRLITVVTGQDFALATSGTAERGEHILDPHTGRPPVGLASVSLVGADLTTVDAYATAAYAMGAEAREWLEHLPDIEALGVTVDGTVWTTSGFDDWVR
jgi:thiamine biosynthesis lipoprotein